MRRSIYILSFVLLTAANFLAAAFAYGQAPTITSFEPKKGAYGEIITINGSGFAPKADLLVKFGTTAAKITEANTTTIRVAVPAGTAYAPISVTNLLPSGLSAQSTDPFLLSFGGQENGTGIFDPYKKLTALGAQDICACDLDGDGRNDLAASNPYSTSITTYLNSSTPGSISFATRKDINTGNQTLSINCKDLNGDGKEDLVLTRNENLVILQNTSSPGMISFAPAITFSVPQKVFGKSSIHDLDGDGKAEIILTNQADNQIIIYKNISTQEGISFDPAFLPLEVSADFAAYTLGLRIKDVNHDGLADITASSLYGSNVFFFINKSTNGNIDFEPSFELKNISSNISNHELEDMDGDGKIDLITTDYINNKVFIHLNNSTSSALSFAAPHPLDATRSYGLQIGDLNGDKKPDFIVGNNNKAEATGFINTSVPGMPGFNPIKFIDPVSSTGKFGNVQISDLDGDAKPDVIAADRENAIFYAFRNATCIYPTINPSGTVNICAGSSVLLKSVQSPGSGIGGGGTPRVTYEWYKDGSLVGNGYSLEATSAGSYHVKMLSLEGCSASSKPVTVNLFNESMGNPTFDLVTASCAGQPLNLSVSPAIDGATYTWTNKITGFTQTTSSNALNIPEADPSLHGGVYKVTIAKQCQIEVESPAITISPLPAAPIINVNGDILLCSGDSRILSTTEGYGGYQWRKDGAAIANASSANYTATATGAYSVVLVNEKGCEAESDVVILESSGNIQASFEAPALACLGQPVQFTNTSTWTSGKTVDYLWDFGDGTYSSSQSPTHTYEQTSTTPFPVTLSIAFEGTDCKSIATHSITVTTTPEITIEARGATAFCEGDSVLVELGGEIAAASWSNGSNGKFTYAKQGGIIQAEILTAAGCTTIKTIELTSLQGSFLELTADRTEIARGETATLQAFGAFSYTWEPIEGLDDPTIANPIASPEQTTTYKVTAVGEAGCTTRGEITITVDNSFKVIAPKLFIPATDHSWVVEKIENYPDISLTIINKFGAKVFSASPYQNDWKGTDSEIQLNDGVYFYIFKDQMGNTVKTGSITLVR